MARDLDLRGRITMDGADQAADQLDDIATAAEQVEEPVKLRVDADVDQALNGLEELDQAARADAVAMEALAQAMGPELTARSDMGGVVDELKRLGLTTEQVTANAEQLGAQLRVMGDNSDLGGKLGQSLGTARGEAEKLSDSARGANSALANMIGNSVQDLGALGGVAGSAGVAIGQIGEYAADAALGGEKLGSALVSMAKVAGPMAAIAVVTQVITAELARVAETKAFNQARVQSFADALDDAKLSAKELSDALSDEGETGIFVRIANETKNVDRQVQDLFGTFEEFQAQVDKGTAGYDRWSQAQQDAARAAGMGKLQLAQLKMALDDAADGTLTGQSRADALAGGFYNTAQAATALGAAVSGVGTATKDSAFQTEFYGDSLEDTDEAQQRAAESAAQAAAAALEYQRVLSSGDWGTSTIDAATEAFTRLGEQQFGAANIASQAQASYDDLNAAIAENGFTFDLATEQGRANAEQIQNLYSSLVPAMAAAYDNANGSLRSFRGEMGTLATQTFQQLQEQTDLTDDQIREVMDRLGAFDGSTYASTFEMLGVEDATTKLGLLSGVIGSLPEDVQRQVTLAVIAGDPQAALDIIQASASGGAVVPLSADPSAAESTAAGFQSEVESTTVTAPMDADTAAADKAQRGFVSTTEGTTAVAPVDANTKAAINTMMYLRVLAALLAPVVQVSADPSAAYAALARLAGTTTRTPVDAYLHDYPSAGEIASRIGVVRVPVDTYLRNEVRVTGGRP